MNAKIGTALTVLMTVLLSLVLVKWLILPGPIQRDAPRQLPFTLPDHRLAEKSVDYLADGTLRVTVDHALLPGVTPEMVAWFYRQLPISTIEYRGRIYPLYHFFHPTEHGTIWVEEPADDGRAGMGVGARVARDEWFGPYDSRGGARMVEFSNEGMLAIASVAGIRFGAIRHIFAAAPGGTRYRLEATIGSDLPVLGDLLNIYLLERVYHPAMVDQWLRHQVEEVSTLQYFLPQIYAARNEQNHYVFPGE